jgi:hypothetical protein
LTGDNIGNAARVAGDTLYGGPIGFAMSLVNAYEVNKTGKDIPDHVVAMFRRDKTKTAPTVADTGTMLAAPPPSTSTRTAMSPTTGTGAPHIDGLPVDSHGAIPMAAALAALQSKPAIELAAFPNLGQQTAMPPPAPIPLTPPTPPQPAALVSALPSGARSFAIDTSSAGIAAMRGHVQSGAGVPFQLPAGVMLTNQPQPLLTVPSGGDFAQKMKQGLAKYQAMLAQQAAQHSAVMAAQPAS